MGAWSSLRHAHGQSALARALTKPPQPLTCRRLSARLCAWSCSSRQQQVRLGMRRQRAVPNSAPACSHADTCRDTRVPERGTAHVCMAWRRAHRIPPGGVIAGVLSGRAGPWRAGGRKPLHGFVPGRGRSSLPRARPPHLALRAHTYTTITWTCGCMTPPNGTHARRCGASCWRCRSARRPPA